MTQEELVKAATDLEAQNVELSKTMDAKQKSADAHEAAARQDRLEYFDAKQKREQNNKALQQFQTVLHTQSALDLAQKANAEAERHRATADAATKAIEAQKTAHAEAMAKQAKEQKEGHAEAMAKLAVLQTELTAMLAKAKETEAKPDAAK